MRPSDLFMNTIMPRVKIKSVSAQEKSLVIIKFSEGLIPVTQNLPEANRWYAAKTQQFALIPY